MQNFRNHLTSSLSILVPGLAQAARGQARQALVILSISSLLLAIAWGIGRTSGISAVVFFVMLIVLPWWTIQAYDAFLVTPAGAGLGRTLRIIWQRAHDIRYLGALFLLTALTDFYIIIANPQYSLTIFCMKPGGLLGGLAKAQSPTLHTLIGYGFLRLRRWSLFVYLAYAAFGLLNATANYACFGYGRVRTAFLLTLLAFTGYILWRRDRFLPAIGPRSTF
jgi:hypothetical protein